MAHRVPITIRLNSFEGPLDLLLYLIQSHEMDISKISIRKITDQYLGYVKLMQELNFDIASDFLLMAATLIQWKSKALLPQENVEAAQAQEDEIMTQEELLRQLMEHQRFLEAGQNLNQLSLLGDDVFTRPHLRKPTEKVWKEMDVTSLAVTFQDLLVRERKRTTILKKETVSLSTKISHFADRLKIGALIGMSTLIDEMKSRPEVVVTFLASLELSRLKKMRLHQEGTYQEIYVELLESIQGFNSELATGFEYVLENIEKGAGEAAATREQDRETAARTKTDFDLASFGEDHGNTTPGNTGTSDLSSGAVSAGTDGRKPTHTDGAHDTYEP